jgi:hypothetical protein
MKVVNFGYYPPSKALRFEGSNFSENASNVDAWAKEVVDHVTAALALNKGYWRGDALRLTQKLEGEVTRLGSQQIQALYTALERSPFYPPYTLSTAIFQRALALNNPVLPVVPPIHIRREDEGVSRPMPWKDGNTETPLELKPLVSAVYPTWWARRGGL